MMDAQTKLTDEQYRDLKRFAGLFLDWYFDKGVGKPEDHPMVLLAALEEKAMAQAKRSLRMLVNDFMEFSSDWSPAQVAEADERLLASDAIIFSKVRHEYSRKYASILKRGSIRNETEYFLLKGVRDGVFSPDDPENVTLDKMMSAYEEKVVKART